MGGGRARIGGEENRVQILGANPQRKGQLESLLVNKVRVSTIFSEKTRLKIEAYCSILGWKQIKG
jgi:hypothetical protein